MISIYRRHFEPSKSSEETVASNQTWKQAFTYDHYGNRNFDEAETTTLHKGCTESSLPVVCAADRKILNPSANASNNRLSSADDYVFDSSGNTTEDAHGRTFIYDAENKQVEVKDDLNQTVGKYWYDGDGKRIKKYVPATGETTVFVYDAMGKLIADYSTEIAPDPKVSYMTNDHLGSPRILTDENGEIISRRDFHSFGEEISTSDRNASLGYQPDDVRQKFTTYERDSETDLDFAQARMYAKHLGRFNSPDPLYFQESMVFNPHTFNLYTYSRNNPYKWIDPNGEEVRVAQGSSLDDIYKMVGGEEVFNEYFHISDGKILVRDGADISGANAGVQFLGELVDSSKVFAVYVGADADAVARMFDGTVNKKGDLNSRGRAIAQRFRSSGYIVRTRGRRGHIEQPNAGDFMVLAINSETFNLTQNGLGGYSYPEGVIEMATQMTGIGQRVQIVSMLIHELAENLDFSQNGTNPRFSSPPNSRLYNNKATRQHYLFLARYHRGMIHYTRAHNYAIRREAQIRKALNITGGFAGGCLGSDC